MDIAAAPSPVKYAFHDAVSVPTMPTMPLIPMIVVQYDDWNGRPRTLVFEPTVPDGSAEAPFYRNLRRLVDKVPGGRLAERVVLRYYNEPADVLALLGLSPGSDRRVVTHPPYPGRPRSHPVRGFDSYAGSLVRSYWNPDVPGYVRDVLEGRTPPTWVTDHVGGILVIPDADAPTTAAPARAGDGGAGLLPTDFLKAPLLPTAVTCWASWPTPGSPPQRMTSSYAPTGSSPGKCFAPQPLSPPDYAEHSRTKNLRRNVSRASSVALALIL
ncbi:hypothetical protein [Streptomyces fungicidicus]|uniref:hypothetical protein n=1 Tax=Streptomyces fungicidicus TaxID=68203 RepID=UPI0036CA5E15